MKSNRSIVLNALIEHSPISRIDLSKLTKLNKATITNVVNGLLEEQLVVSVGTLNRGVGRTANLLMFNKDAGVSVGVEISVGKVIIIITDLAANILWEMERDFDTTSAPLEVFNLISQCIKDGLNEVPDTPRKLLGIGVGIPSQVIPETGAILPAVERLNWNEIPIVEWLQKDFDVPIFLGSKADLCIIAEKSFGKAVNFKNTVFLSVGIGIGAGIMINEQLYRGAGYVGIVGHTVIDPSGPLCLCGRKGCWELMGSGIALEDKSIEQTILEANAGEAESIEALSLIGENLGVGIANLILTIGPELIILGGRISKANQWILNPCIRVLKTSLPQKIFEKTVIEISEMDPYACAIGGVSLVLNSTVWHTTQT